MSRIGNIEQVARQRNIFIVLCILSMSACLMLTIKIITSNDRTILVPGLIKRYGQARMGSLQVT
jgi:hypothetical protein